MQPNVNVYGAENTWVNILPPSDSDRYVDNKNYIPAWRTIGGGISAGKIDDNKPLDNSICYAAIADDSPAAGITCVPDNNISGAVETKEFAEPFFISGGDTPGGTTQNYYDIVSDFPTNWVYVHNMIPGNMNNKLNPLCSCSLKDLLMVINVVAVDSNFENPTSFPYNTYKQLHVTNYPYIVRIYGTAYCRNPNGNDRDRTLLTNGEYYNASGFARMGEFDIPNVTGKYTDYAAAISRTGGLTFHMWGIATENGIEPYWGSGSYVHKAIGSGGQFHVHSGRSELCYYREWGAPRYEHSADDWVRRVAASYGVFFVDRIGYATGANAVAYRSENMYLGTIDEQGLCHGDYTTGEDNISQPQYNWESTNDSTFDPNAEIDRNKYYHETTLPTLPYYVSPYNVYVDVGTGGAGGLIKSLCAWVGTLSGIQQGELFYGQEPLENVIASRRIYLKAPEGTDLGSSETVKLGATASDFSARTLNKEWKRYEFPAKQIFPKFGNFLDYEPYTTISLYIPYCGVTKLPSAIFMGHNCKFTLNANLRTGQLEALIYVDNIEYATLKGDAGMDMAVTGLAMAEFNQRKKQLQYQYDMAIWSGIGTMAGNASGMTISGAYGNIGGVATQGVMLASNLRANEIQRGQIKLELQHSAPETLSIQKSIPEINAINCLTPFLFIERPVYEDGFNPSNQAIYSKTVGHACYRIGNLSDFTGYTEGVNPLLDNISMTLEEREMLEEALREGVILDEEE